jgi:hypothetical protein
MMSSAGGGQATPPPPPRTNSFNGESKDSAENVIDVAMDAKFMANAEQEAEEERAAHIGFNPDQQRHSKMAAAEEESNDDNN